MNIGGLGSESQCTAARFRQVFAVLVLSFAWMHPSTAATYYVSTAGNDNNSGTSVDAPLRTIQKAVNKAVAGDTVLVRGGTYREQVEANNAGTASNPINVFAYSGEIPVIKGSDVVTGWTQYNSTIWKKTGWSSNSQQVFVDFDAKPANSLQQIGMPSQYYTTYEYPNAVGSGLGSMAPGTFYYDPSSATLYVWLADGSDPNRHVVEASVRRRLFYMHQPFVHMKGFVFRHSNSSAFAQQGAAVELSSNSTLEVCDIQYTDFSGLSLGYLQDNAFVHDCNVSNNGDSGVVGAGSRNFRVANVTINGNNSRRFNVLWHAGGFKAATGAYGIVENSEVGYNNGSGIWFDYANSGGQIVIRNNYIHDNGPKDSAIFIEVTKNALVYNNVLVNNSRRGIYISASDNTQVYNNTIVGTASRAGIEVAGMPRGSATLTNNAIYNNIITAGTSQYDLYIMPDDGTTIFGNKSDYNDIYRAGGSISLWSGNSYADLASWRSATNQDMHSLSADPAFVAAGSPPSGADYAVTAGSPVIDAGTSVIISYDYLGVPRPSGSAFDIGAFEAVASAGTGTTDTTGGSTSGTTTDTTSGTPSGTTTDTLAPVVTINSGVGVVDKKGTLNITASATDNVGVTGMELYLDGTLVASSANGQISYRWKRITLGTHEIRATATDAAKNTGTATTTLTVQ